MLIELTLLLSLQDTSTPGEAMESEASRTFGHAVAGVGDVNDDGVPDFLVSDPGASASNYKFFEHGERGRVWMLSGKNGETLWSVSSENIDDGFGSSLESVGDLNEDGVQDWIVGTTDYRKGEVGHAMVRCGRTGALLVSLQGREGDALFGKRVAGVGDLDGDGTPDLAVGAPGFDGDEAGMGRVACFSGKDATLLFHIEGVREGAHLGHEFAGVGDVNQDGFADVAVGAEWGDGEKSVRVVSGEDGSLIWTAKPFDCSSLTSGADSNGDGVWDLVLGDHRRLVVLSGSDGHVLATREGPVYGPAQFLHGHGLEDPRLLVPDHSWYISYGRVEVVSSRTLETAFVVVPDRDTSHFGAAVCGVGDLDDDGVPEFAVGSDVSIAGGSGAAVWVYSGASGSKRFEFKREGDRVSRVHPATLSPKAKEEEEED